MNILERIKNLTDLTKSEMLLVQYIEQNYPMVENIEDISKSTGVSVATISRFVKNKLKYPSFLTLRKDISTNIKQELAAPIDKVMQNDNSIDDYGIAEHFTTCTRNLQNTLSRLNGQDFDKAIELLVGAKNIYTVGGASSSVVSTLLSIYLKYIRSGIHNISSDVSLFAHDLVDICEDDVLVAVAYSRVTKISHDSVKHFHNIGAKVILITDTLQSSLKPYVTAEIPVIASGTPMFNSKVTSIAVVESICYGMMKHHKNKLKTRSKAMEDIFKQFNMFSNS